MDPVQGVPKVTPIMGFAVRCGHALGLGGRYAPSEADRVSTAHSKFIWVNNKPEAWEFTESKAAISLYNGRYYRTPVQKLTVVREIRFVVRCGHTAGLCGRYAPTSARPCVRTANLGETIMAL